RSTSPPGRPPARSPAPPLHRTAASSRTCSPRTGPAAPPAPPAARRRTPPGGRLRIAIACGASSESDLEGEHLVVAQVVSQSGVGVVDRDPAVAHGQAHAQTRGQAGREAPVRARLVAELLADAGEEHPAVRVLRAEG